MIKVEVLETFTFKDYDKVEIIQKKGSKANEFTKGDIFMCDEATADYLSGNNPLKKSVIKVIEVIPEKPVEQAKNIEKPKKKKIDKKVK